MPQWFAESCDNTSKFLKYSVFFCKITHESLTEPNPEYLDLYLEDRAC